MLKCKDVAAYMEKLCPAELACEWDNVGLLVGDKEKAIRKILVTLDVDEDVVAEACVLGVDMIISHHPIMFTPVKRMTESDPQQRAIRTMCRNDICLYAAHTNMDCAEGGLNDYLAEKLGFEDRRVFEPTICDAGFGRYTKLPETSVLGDMLALCKERLNLASLRYVGDPGQSVDTVVVNCGSGSSCLEKCIEEGVDLLITGDLKYTAAREAYANNVAVIDAGHYGTEIIFTELVRGYLSEGLQNIEIFVSRANKSVLNDYC